MYKLELTDEEINKAIKMHLDNYSDSDTEEQQDKADSEAITQFAKSINVFYDDDIGHFWNKHANDNSHHWYKILITDKKQFKFWTEIGLPQNQVCYEEFSLNSVITALSFEVANPENYEISEEKQKQAMNRYNKNSQAIYDKFGEFFYSCILSGEI